MSQIYSILGIPDTDRSYVNTIGQSVVYDAVQEALQQMDQELSAAIGLFVGETTEDFKRRYKLPGGGYLQRRNRLGAPGAVKAVGQWDVAFPLEDFGDQIAIDDISLAYMTMQELNRHLDTVEARNRNTMRREILVALVNNVDLSFVDEVNGTLTCVPLANGDAIVYPPVLGSDAEATENHYKETGYAVASISDANDPMEDAVAELEEHFGTPTGGSEIIKFGGKTLCDKLASTLTDFVDVDDLHVDPGANAAQVIGLPEGASVPGKLRGRHTAGCWLSEWRHIPDNYSISLHLGAPPPLIQRVDPADTGIGQGLLLVAVNEKFPLQGSFYRNRFGLGVGNRLNGLVHEYGTGGSYTIPTTLAR
jgi:hypothetical protein